MLENKDEGKLNSKSSTNAGKTFDDDWRLNISKGHAGIEVKSARRFSDEQEREICYHYISEEMSAYALGKKFECNANLISSILERNNIQIRKSNYTGHSNGRNIFTTEQESDICREYSLGNSSMISLGKKYGCSRNTIRNCLLKHKVSL